MTKTAPYISSKNTTQNLMREVGIALLPCMAVSIYFYGTAAVKILLSTVIFSFFTEIFWQNIKKERTHDGSGIIAGLILALSLPSTTPFYVAGIGGVIAISSKHILGGLGKNLFNPAILGRLFLMIVFPMYLYQVNNFDGTAGVSLYPIIKYGGLSEIIGDLGEPLFYRNLILGNRLGSIGESSIIAVFLGYVYLVCKKSIKWEGPVILLGTIYVLNSFVSPNPFLNMIIGGGLFASVFIVTDPVTSPYTRLGYGFYLVLMGIFIFGITEFTSQPTGITMGILGANLMVPIINRYTPNRVFAKSYPYLKLVKLILISSLFIMGGFYLVTYKNKEIIPKGINYTNLRKYFGSDVEFEDKIIEDGFIYYPLKRDEMDIGTYVVGDSKGYGKERIGFDLAVDTEHKIKGLTITHEKETWRLGDQISSSCWQNQWIGRDSSYKFNKEVDGFLGATYTSKNLHRTFKKILQTHERLFGKGYSDIDGSGGATDTYTDGTGGATDIDGTGGATD
ncbi:MULTISPECIES: RnfABCDGE type electron transport complex subunit D [Psychrilyobacter]|uniref:FMN-binding protein n=1 Tax=Psychrilyobacter piezotolerans TaxID=2293438 RepID=A0ABX9KG57_9FUSO|nr:MULTISPECIES: RnfABCDGE type electron transport complex subunit D [Psychrilyobacter]MCS5420471.1 RnfABCDGE type electron transport complex subunit D [Psychrilyobacter sp. S5]NDI78249.1 FMN-binding protein [Psychrilyobacter piezotolerans]RDE61192.1 FMN-binding protein [Psychrilyobacter sp. S5]REI40860.1 FMN-binding protein [Psychrilyobacter piezotolerans]